MNSDGFAHLLKLNSIIFQEALYFLCNPGSAAQCILFGTCGFDIVVDEQIAIITFMTGLFTFLKYFLIVLDTRVDNTKFIVLKKIILKSYSPRQRECLSPRRFLHFVARSLSHEEKNIKKHLWDQGKIYIADHTAQTTKLMLLRPLVLGHMKHSTRGNR